MKYRIDNGIRNWCENKEAKEILKKADVKIQKLVEEINSQINAITLQLVQFKKTSMAPSNLPETLLEIAFGTHAMFPLVFLWQWLIGESGVRSRARDHYRKAISQIKFSELKQGFEESFGKNFDNWMHDIWEKQVSKKINELTNINEQLARECRFFKKGRATFIRLKDEINEIMTLLRQRHHNSSV